MQITGGETMCTCLVMKNSDTYFGRNLDLDVTLNQEIVIVSRNFPFKFRKLKPLNKHYAIMGIACVVNNYPLYFDATNEHGLSIAGLRFHEEVKSRKPNKKKINLAQFEFIPYVLGTCRNIKEAVEVIKNIEMLDINFSSEIHSSNLHYMIADKKESYVIEFLSNGVSIYKNPYGVLTNSPPFPFHLENVRLYLNLTNGLAESSHFDSLKLTSFTSGQGTYGIPMDKTSPSRFIKATFLKFNSLKTKDEFENVNQFFKILDNVSVIKGEVKTPNNNYEYTMYSSCVNLNKQILYYKTYNDPTYRYIKLNQLNLKTDKMYRYQMSDKTTFSPII